MSDTNNDTASDIEAPAEEPMLETAAEAAIDEAIEADDGDEGDEAIEPSAASKAIAALGLTRMTLQELKEKSPADLVAFAEQLDIENANSMRKQDIMFAILKTLAEEGIDIGGSGTLEVVQDGFGFLRSPEANYLPGPDDIYVSPSHVRRHGLRVPFVFQAHGSSWTEAVSKWRSRRPLDWAKSLRNLGWIAKDALLYRRFDQLVFVGEALQRQFEQPPLRWMVRGVATTTIANGIDTTRFRFDRRQGALVRRRFGFAAEDAVLVFSGRLHAHKGAAEAIRAVAMLRKEDESYRLLLIGDGAERAALGALAESLGCAGSVCFAGAVPREEVPGLLSAGSVLVFPALGREGLPLNVLEALSVGLPCVCAESLRPIFEGKTRAGHAHLCWEHEGNRAIRQGNWKLVMENNRECYHCAGAHPSLGIACDYQSFYVDRGEGARYDKKLDSLFPLRDGMKTFSMDGELVCRQPLGGGSLPDQFSAGFIIVPNLSSILYLPDHAVIHDIKPLTVDTCQMVCSWFVHEDAVEGVDYDTQSLTEVFHVTNLEDGALAERTQMGVRSRRYVPGPNSPTRESFMKSALSGYLTMMGEPAAR